MRTVLITGVAGFIGYHLANKYLNENWKVIGVDNFITGSKENVKNLIQCDNFWFIQGDIINNPINGIFRNIDLILHFASPASPKYYQNYPLETLKVNSKGTYNMLELAKSTNSRFIFASTSEIYGDPLEIPQKESYWGNINPIGCRSVYDEGKRFGESLTMEYIRQGIGGIILRIFNTYGPFMSKKDGRVIPNFINQCLNREDITIYGEGKQIRSFCYISDLIECIYKVSIKEELRENVFNIGNPEPHTINDVAHILKDIIKTDSEIVYKKLPEDDPKIRIPNINRIKNEINWTPQIKLKEGLIKTINYYLS